MNESPDRCQAVRTAAYDEALAEHLDLNPTDLRCLELVIAEPDLTPGRLAERSGLTTGAITGVLDRLERAGFVVRRPDPDDRRSVTVVATGAERDELDAAIRPLRRRVDELLSERTAGERRAIQAFLDAASAAVAEETARLRAGSRGGFVGDTFTAPLGEVTRGRLVFVSGAPRVAMQFAPLGPRASARVIVETSATRLALAGDAPSGALLRGRFTGPLPDVRVANGVVTIRYRRGAAAAFSNRRARIGLNPTIPWVVEVEGGITDLDGSLELVKLSRMDLSGGANHLSLSLPAPSGTVGIRVSGVVNSARIRRPAAVPAAIRVAVGVSHLKVDDRRHEAVGGEQRFETDGFATTPDRYEVELLGGADSASLTRT